MSKKQIKKPALSTLVLGIASAVTLVGGLLAWGFSSALWVPFMVVVVGVGLTWVQWAVGNREHRQELAQERASTDMKMLNAAINADSIRIGSVIDSYREGKARLEAQQPKAEGSADA